MKKNSWKWLDANSKKGFAILAGINRPINPAHVSKLAESIRDFGMCIRPVLVAHVKFLPSGPAWYIIDGQHLYIAALRLKLDIPYIEMEVNSLEELIERIAQVNTTSKPWVLEDYITSWGYYKPSYQELKRLYQLYNIERSILAELLHTGIVTASRVGGSSIPKVIKKGQFKILNLQLAVKVLDYITDLRDVTNDLGRQEQRLIISIMIEKIKADGGSYKHEIYKKYLTSIKKDLLIASNDIETLRSLLSK